MQLKYDFNTIQIRLKRNENTIVTLVPDRDETATTKRQQSQTLINQMLKHYDETTANDRARFNQSDTRHLLTNQGTRQATRGR